jgi:hypothetical protein
MCLFELLQSVEGEGLVDIKDGESFSKTWLTWCSFHPFVQGWKAKDNLIFTLELKSSLSKLDCKLGSSQAMISQNMIKVISNFTIAQFVTGLESLCSSSLFQVMESTNPLHLKRRNIEAKPTRGPQVFYHLILTLLVVHSLGDSHFLSQVIYITDCKRSLGTAAACHWTRAP